MKNINTRGSNTSDSSCNVLYIKLNLKYMNLVQMLQPNALRCISLWLNLVFYHIVFFLYLHISSSKFYTMCKCINLNLCCSKKKKTLFCSTIWGLFRDMQKNMLSKRFKPKPLRSFLLPLTSTFHLFPKSHTTWHFFLINRIFTSSALIEWGGTMTSLCMHVRVGGGGLWHHCMHVRVVGGHYDITL